MHILLIEDDINAASYVTKGLKESGHVVDHASDAEEEKIASVDEKRNGGVFRSVQRFDAIWRKIRRV